MSMWNVAEVPLVDVGRGGSAALCERHAAVGVALVRKALSTLPLLGLFARGMDPVSRRWLVRHGSPYLAEIDRVARLLGMPGVYFLNVVYEWGCSTSAARDPTSHGMRLIRVLDWRLEGTGAYALIARHETAIGPFYNVTWPGYAGVVTAMAPGRFAAAINQAPRLREAGIRLLDEGVARWRMLREGGLPATHLLRQVFEQATNYSAAVAMLTGQGRRIAMPAIFTIAGIRPGEAAVVEAIGAERRLHRVDVSNGDVIGVANDWLSDDFDDFPRAHAVERDRRETAKENNYRRRAMVCELHRHISPVGVADLPAPVINAHTVMVTTANAATGLLHVELLDRVPGAERPTLIARRTLNAVA